MSVAVAGATKTYRSRAGSVTALADVDLSAVDGELLVVVGPSGSGKTTLLRSIAGLEELDEGTISVGGRDVTRLPPGERGVAMVFQEYALYPHMTVAANITFGMRARKEGRGEIERRLESAARHLDIEDVLARRPSELSGGERQRVALARAMVREPDAYLMDEPLSDLDAKLRAQMRTEIRNLQRAVGATMLYVTHDQIEAMTMADRVAVLRDGLVEQVASPVELYDHPATAFVARFVGNPPMNLVDDPPWDPGVTVGIRPEHVALVPPGAGRIDGRIAEIEFTGHESVVHVDCGPTWILVKVPRGFSPRLGAETGVSFQDSAIRRFSGRDGAAL
ncbi:MAG TPA: ABC transporter ATP-binding protein [Actinomycetota bacterium]|nr:ABC transporter ATP-binding protein [Actinomycetota bacterium]